MAGRVSVWLDVTGRAPDMAGRSVPGCEKSRKNICLGDGE
jgi:hypothetical protein